MIGFRVPPDQAGDPKIFAPRIIFLVPGFLLFCVGLWEAWRYFRLPPPSDGDAHPFRLSFNLMDINLEPRAIAGVCAIVFFLTGALFLTLGIYAEIGLRNASQPQLTNANMFVRARQFTFAGGLVGYLYLFGFVISPLLCKALPGFVVGLIWVTTAGALCAAILRFFRRKPVSK